MRNDEPSKSHFKLQTSLHRDAVMGLPDEPEDIDVLDETDDLMDEAEALPEEVEA